MGGRMTSKREPDPFIFFTRENGKLALCLSYVGKWLAGVIATLLTTAAIATFGLVWSSATNSQMALQEIRSLSEKVERLDKDAGQRLDRYEDRLRDLERSQMK
jgi:hypothetical protein